MEKSTNPSPIVNPLMDKKRVCKICNKQFANGRTMGCHMRTHLLKRPLPHKPNPPPTQQLKQPLVSNNNPDTLNPSSSPSSSSSLNYTSPEVESEAESLNPSRVSSSVLYCCFNEREAANSLLMLSSHVDEKKRKGKQVIGEEAEDESYYTCHNSSKCRQGKYMCEICNKVFRSYQALGGHKASHKKTKAIEEETYIVGGFLNQRIFRCCYCDKVFESGQALGGHKRVHFPHLGNKPIPKSSVACEVKDLIDLNLPPPEALED